MSKDYSSKNFGSLTFAYNQYQKDRTKQTPNPTMCPRDKFAHIYGWTSKVKKPGK